MDDKPSFTLAELHEADDEQLRVWFSAFTQEIPDRVAKRRRTALIAALRNVARQDASSPVKTDQKRAAAPTEKVEISTPVEQAQVEYSFAMLKAIAEKHDVKGRSKAALLAALKEKNVDLAASIEREEEKEEKGDGQEEEEEEEKPRRKSGAKKKKKEESDSEYGEGDSVVLSGKSSLKKMKQKRKQMEEDEEEEEDVSGESEDDRKTKKKKRPAKKSKSEVPFTATQLLCATMKELKEFAVEVGAESKRKDDLLRELRDMLPKDEQWASSEDNWDSIRLPGTNEYGNIDVREGISSKLVHVHGLRLGPTARAHHIPCAPAMVGFNSYRGHSSPILDGIVIRRKDLVKLEGFLALKDVKQERKVEREEKKQMTPKVKAPWTFEQLPEEERSHLRDFSLLPRDNWIVIFRFTFAGDIVSCGRVSKGLLRISQDEQLWRSKLFDDFSISCEAHKTMSARDAYLALASVGTTCGVCRPLRPNLSLIDTYHSRARKWLNESIRTDREQALSEACRKIGVSIHPSSKLAPSFIAGNAGDRSANEVATILKGVSILFSSGGHRAFSELHETLHVELARIKFTQRVTWVEALRLWEQRHKSSMSAAYLRYEDNSGGYDSDDSYGRYRGGGGGGGCWTCGSYGHQARNCYLR